MSRYYMEHHCYRLYTCMHGIFLLSLNVNCTPFRPLSITELFKTHKSIPGSCSATSAGLPNTFVPVASNGYVIFFVCEIYNVFLLRIKKPHSTQTLDDCSEIQKMLYYPCDMAFFHESLFFEPIKLPYASTPPINHSFNKTHVLIFGPESKIKTS